MSWKEKLVTELIDLKEKCSIQNWDGHESNPVDISACDLAKKFIYSLPNNIFPPVVGFDSEGPELYWFKDDFIVLSLAVDISGLSFYGEYNGAEVRGDFVPFSEFIPGIILDWLRRAYR